MPSDNVKDKTNMPESKLLSELPVGSYNLQFGLNFHHTLVPMTGFINNLRGKTQAIDVDISCILYDEQCKIIEIVWFKQLRNHDAAIRHNGDSLNGKDRGDAAQLDKDIDMELIELKLDKLDLRVAHLALSVSSYYGQPLSEVESGNISLRDDENNELLVVDLTYLPKECCSVWVAGLSRELDEWRMTTHNLPLESFEITAMARQISQELARSYISI